MFAVICLINYTIKNIPTRYTLPDEMETHGQVVISQLKSLDFTEKKTKSDRIFTFKRYG